MIPRAERTKQFTATTGALFSARGGSRSGEDLAGWTLEAAGREAGVGLEG